MSSRTKIFIVLVVLIIIILLIVLFLSGKRNAQEPNQVQDQEPATTQEEEKPTLVLPIKTDSFEQNGASAVVALAKTFSERFGSFSTESEFQNIRDVIPLATAGYSAELESMLTLSVTSGEYYGVSTRVISTDVISLNDAAGTASVSVNTQRQEAKVSVQNTRVYYQTIELDFVKESGVWKVSKASWSAE
ncbi:MAG: hypothetical protein ACD_76C00145G0002 [uncultured bacterium]|nr:MAG: hypothetical protein ACD_76C00145G0002 [uncultured bacterium]HBD05375.1 hypothetical protein [Candidatus Uhrbacteria bacterium]